MNTKRQYGVFHTVLSRCGTVLRLWALFLCFMAIGSGYVSAQTVSGKILDSFGEPVIGASVLVKGTSRGAISDVDGNFTIQAPGDATLVFSSIGYRNIETLASMANSVVMEEDATGIDEVVVTALGMTRSKKAVGYATQDVKSDELNRASNPNMMTALQGKLAGVDFKPSSGMPGASSQIVIRGARSFTGNNTPLYVIDGMPINSTPDYGTGNGVTGSDVSNRAMDIDPSDIESINVLKGQAASALYGIRASNGVIVITTKSGKNQSEGKPTVSFSTNTSFDQISRFPDLQKKYAQGSGGLYNPGTSFSWGPKISELANDPNYGGNTVNRYTDADGLQEGKYYVQQRLDAGLDPWATPQVYNNDRDFMQLGYTNSNSASISQNTKLASYSASIGNATQQGIIPSTDMNRYTFRATAETKLSTIWKTGFTANYNQTAISKAASGNDALLSTVFSSPASYDLKGIPSNKPGSPYEQINYRSLTFNNPYWAMENNKFTEKTNRFFGNSFIAFSPEISTDGSQKLNVRYQFGADSYQSNYEDIFGFGHQGRAGRMSQYGTTNTTYNSLGTIQYDMTVNSDFQFTIMAGNEINHNSRNSFSMYGDAFNFGGWQHISNTQTQQTSGSKEQRRTVGFFANASATYKDMIFLNATGRNDFVSFMPRGARSFFYPSVSLSFVLTELDALKGNDILSFAKVRGSFAQVGQAERYYNDYYDSPSYGGGFWSGSPILYPIGGVNSYIPNTRMYDPNLQPQNTNSYEVGVDFRFLKNRIAIDYNFSRQNVTNQIFPVPLAGSSGAYDMIMNGGKVHTNAHEVVLTFIPVQTKDWDWNVNFNFTKIDNYVDELAPGVESIFLGGFVTPQVRAAVGQKFPVIYGTQFARNEAGQILVDEDPNSPNYGLPYAGKDDIIGSVAPDFTLGASTSVRFKRISLSATFDWKSGGQMYSGSNGLYNLYGVSKLTEDRESAFLYPGFKEDGTANDIVRGGESDLGAKEYFYTTANDVDEAYIYDASFVKLREVAISYQIPIKGSFEIGVSAFVRNILLWTTLPNLDPESSQGNTNMGGAFERFSLPQTTSYGFGVNLKF